MFETLIKFRYFFVIAVIFLLGNAAFFMITGIMHCIHGYVQLASIGFHPSDGDRPGLHLLEGLDAFMIAIVFTVFGLGIAKLFVFDRVQADNLPRWLDIKSIIELKVLLWETILVTLVILCVTHFMKDSGAEWTTLIPSLMVLILAAALFLVKGKQNHG